MQGRARFAWRGKPGRICQCQPARWRAAGCARGWTSRHEPAVTHKPAVGPDLAPFKWLAPAKPNKLLEGFCPEPRQEEQIAVNSNGLMLFLRLADIEWVKTADDCVELHVGSETHQVRSTLAAVAAKLPPDRFLRLNASTLVNIDRLRG